MTTQSTVPGFQFLAVAICWLQVSSRQWGFPSSLPWSRTHEAPELFNPSWTSDSVLGPGGVKTPASRLWGFWLGAKAPWSLRVQATTSLTLLSSFLTVMSFPFLKLFPGYNSCISVNCMIISGRNHTNHLSPSYCQKCSGLPNPLKPLTQASVP